MTELFDEYEKIVNSYYDFMMKAKEADTLPEMMAVYSQTKPDKQHNEIVELQKKISELNMKDFTEEEKKYANEVSMRIALKSKDIQSVQGEVFEKIEKLRQMGR